MAEKKSLRKSGAHMSMLLDDLSEGAERRARVRVLLDFQDRMREPIDRRRPKILFVSHNGRHKFLAHQSFELDIHFTAYDRSPSELCAFIENPRCNGVHVWEGDYTPASDSAVGAFTGSVRAVSPAEWDLFTSGKHPFEEEPPEVQEVLKKRRAILLAYWEAKDQVASAARLVVLQTSLSQQVVWPVLRNQLAGAVKKMEEALELLCD